MNTSSTTSSTTPPEPAPDNSTVVDQLRQEMNTYESSVFTYYNNLTEQEYNAFINNYEIFKKNK
jgi:hypothetical protein